MTAKEWREDNPELAKNGNIRDYTDLLYLIILNNLENTNAELIRMNIKQSDRLIRLNESARNQMKALKNNKNIKVFYFETKEEFEKIMKINLFAPYYICQKIIPYMKNMKFGKIINISSDLSVRTVKNATEYSISKAGLDALTRSIAVEYGEYGIRANTININGMKGYTTKVNEITDIFSKNDEDYDDWKQPKERIPLSRRGTFDEFVDVIEFLCSEKSNYITGVNIPVDGGIIAKL